MSHDPQVNSLPYDASFKVFTLRDMNELYTILQLDP